jgi:5-methylcytosine-specific restriction protein A
MGRESYGRIQGRKGQAIRKRRLAQSPLCVECLSHGLYIEATQVDHIKALSNGGTDTDDNVQSLCAKHHDAKTAQDLGYKTKPTIGLDGWHTS